MTALVGVYRVENREGSGPYCGGASCHPAVEAHGRYGSKSLAEHPAPWEDGLTWGADFGLQNQVFGFASLKDASAWFAPDELRRLARDGYHLRRFWVREDRIACGGRQVAFRKPPRPAPSALRPVKELVS